MKRTVLFFSLLSLVYGQYPVLLIPGDGGSHMEARLNRNDTPRLLCYKRTTDWYNIWLNLELLIPYFIDCWVSNVELVYDNVTHTTRNNDGVDIRVPGFGNTSSVEWLDPNKRSISKYFAYIADSLVKIGLVRDKSIRGAPYDFRKTPLENMKMLNDMKILVEDMYGDLLKPVILLCHSMGCLYAKYFLQLQSQTWKDKYIHSFISLSAPWAGTVKALKMYISGDNLDAYPLNALKIRDGQRTYPSLAWLLPRKELWNDEELLVYSPNKNYSLSTLKELFLALDLPDVYSMWLDNRDLIYLPSSKIGPFKNEPSLGVKLYCMYGTKVMTPEQLAWDAKTHRWPDSQPAMVYGDGDGSVNLRSLEACKNFDTTHNSAKNYSQQSVSQIVFPGVEHVHILYNMDVINAIIDIVMGNQTFLKTTLSHAKFLSGNRLIKRGNHPMFLPIIPEGHKVDNIPSSPLTRFMLFVILTLTILLLMMLLLRPQYVSRQLLSLRNGFKSYENV